MNFILILAAKPGPLLAFLFIPKVLELGLESGFCACQLSSSLINQRSCSFHGSDFVHEVVFILKQRILLQNWRHAFV